MSPVRKVTSLSGRANGFYPVSASLSTGAYGYRFVVRRCLVSDKVPLQLHPIYEHGIEVFVFGQYCVWKLDIVDTDLPVRLIQDPHRDPEVSFTALAPRRLLDVEPFSEVVKCLRSSAKRSSVGLCRLCITTL